ncbi:WD40 repeat-like protein [Aureobasidium subglaciale]|nr:WD40 repeat-like protein [Aureobasidium subglaciale]
MTISASENPTVVYLQNLTLRTPAIQLHPSASSAAIAAAAFHPERPNVFLLAFKDGGIAAYDATKIARNSGRIDNKSCLTTNGHAGEISHFKTLHRITNVRNMSDPPDASTNTTIGSKSVAITGAAFLPGFRTRAVSVGADGRCRLVDFEAGGKILRTWHAQAPVTSLSILAAKVQSQPVKKTGHRQRSGAVGGPIETKTVIAVGRVDGQVLLFDSVGLRLDQVVVDDLGEKIISVEWLKGPSPHAITSSFQPRSAGMQTCHTLSSNNHRPGVINETGLPEALRLPPGAVFDPVQVLPQVIVYISEAEDVSTVRHTPDTGAIGRSPVETNYLDLFSPVKKVSPARARKSPVSTQLRRSRLSSHTFVKTSSPGPTLRELDPVTESSEPTEHISTMPLHAPVVSKQTSPPRVTPPASARHGPRSARKRVHIHAAQNQFQSPGSSAVVGRNGKVLADLRKLSTGNSIKSKRGGNAALFAPYMNRTGIANLPRTGTQPLVEDEPKVPRQTLPNEHAHETHRHQTLQQRKFECGSESRSSDRDIWLSAGSSDETCNQRDYIKHTHYHARSRQSEQPHAQPAHTEQSHLPLVYEASRPKCAPFVPISKPEPAPEAILVSPRPQNSGKEAAVLSMSEEAMFSAVSHISNIDGEFMPDSKAVQTLFPRSSSVYSTSPSQRQSPRRSTKRQVQVLKDETLITRAIPNPNPGPKPMNMRSSNIFKSATRDAAAKKAAALLLGSGGTSFDKDLPSLPSNDTTSQAQSCDCTKKSCQGCKELSAKVRSLEDEVARLKAEVLGLRSALRKTGVSSRVKERSR